MPPVAPRILPIPAVILVAASLFIASARATRAQEPLLDEPVRHAAPGARVAARVVVAGVDVTGLSDAAALAKLRAALEGERKKPLRLVIGEYQYTFGRDEFGAQIPYVSLLREARASGTASLRLEGDRARIVKELRLLAPQVSEDFERTSLNVGGTAVRVEKALEAAEPTLEALVTLAPEPRVTAPSEPERPASGAPQGFSYLLADFSTAYKASLRGRTTNLRKAAQNMNGTIVPPNGIFSTNRAIGPRNAGDGWREAAMFVSGRVVSGVGSGICQAATTLYNCAVLANLDVVERHPHSMRVTYIEPSRDAALLWGSKDFKFRNTTGAPLKVETFLRGGRFHVRLWSPKPRTSPRVQIVSRVLSSSGRTRSEAFKVVGGQQIRLSRDSYAPLP